MTAMATGGGSTDLHDAAPIAGKAPAHGYRPDIDGLRTVAVLSVVLFHLGLPWIPGGYAGVDIFFVISGYLITRIIAAEAARGDFSVLRFYERRARRIFPALFVTLIGVAVAAAIIFMPDEVRDTGLSLASTTLFASNILFWFQVDYFADPAEFKPLLHTWSLAVEEQFYLVIPALVLLVWRWRPAAIKPVFVALLLVSFAASCAWVFIDRSGNYYLPHTRAWELLVGSIFAIGVVPAVASKRLNDLLSLAALALLIAPLFLLNEQSVFPAWNAVAPCLGAGLLIHTGERGATPAAQLLGFRPIAAFGLISYSLYLVHWPLIVFVKYQLLREMTPVETAACAAAMMALAWASWRFVEAPFRDRKRVSRKAIFALSGGAGAIVLAIAALFVVTNGLPQRFGKFAELTKRPDPRNVPFTQCFMRKGWKPWVADRCYVRPGKGPGDDVVLLWGDSHAHQYVEPIMDPAAGIRSRVLYYASAGCPPVLGVDIEDRPDCRANNDHALEIVRRYNVKKVILSGYWERVLKDSGLGAGAVRSTVDALHRMGVKVAIIGDNPDFPFANPNFLALRLAQRPDPKAPFYAPIRNDPAFNAEMERAAGADAFFDPLKGLCRGLECLAYVDGEVMMRDNAHLTVPGGKLVLRQMRGRGIIE